MNREFSQCWKVLLTRASTLPWGVTCICQCNLCLQWIDSKSIVTLPSIVHKGCLPTSIITYFADTVFLMERRKF